MSNDFAKKKLLENLETEGIGSSKVLDAIKKVPSILLPNLGVVDAKRIESKVYEI